MNFEIYPTFLVEDPKKIFRFASDLPGGKKEALFYTHLDSVRDVDVACSTLEFLILEFLIFNGGSPEGTSFIVN